MKKTLIQTLIENCKYYTAFLFSLVLVCVLGCGPSKPVLYFYTWEDYIDPEVVSEFEKLYDCNVMLETFESNEDMVAKIRAGSVHYDVLLPTTYMIHIMHDEGLLLKLNPELIPNVIQNSDRALAKKNGDPNFEFSVPYYGGITGLGYLANECDQLPDSWDVFNGTNSKYTKRIALLNDMRETIGAALIKLGYDINTTDEKQLEEAKQLVIQWKKSISNFGVDDLKEALGSGANYIIHGYSGDIIQMTAEDNNIRFCVPKEGAIIWFDNLVIPANANNPELAHKFINFMCDQKNAGRNMEYTKYNVCVKGAEEAVSEETKKLPGFIVLTDELKERLEAVKNLNDENTKKYTKVWDEIKAAD